MFRTVQNRIAVYILVGLMICIVAIGISSGAERHRDWRYDQGTSIDM